MGLERERLFAERKDKVEKYTTVVMTNWGEMSSPVPVPEKIWIPKNVELHIPVDDEKAMTAELWATSNFPYRSIPKDVSTHVKAHVWAEQISEWPRMPLR